MLAFCEVIKWRMNWYYSGKEPQKMSAQKQAFLAWRNSERFQLWVDLGEVPSGGLLQSHHT